MSNKREDIRKFRLNVVENSIKGAKERDMIIDKERLIATICIDFGCSRRTALEYINILVASGRVTL